MDLFALISETALKLDSLVGDIEDAVTSVMNRNLKKHSARQYSEVISANYLQLNGSCSESCFKG